MKKFLLSSLLISGLLAQNITLKSGWHLLGSSQDINVTSFDDSGCVNCLWKYDFLDKNSPWKLHISNKAITNTNSFKDFSTIKTGEGFWINIKDSNCSINTDTNNYPIKNYMPKPKDITDRMAIRFLTKATFGPTPESVKHLKEIGFEKWIDEQLSMPKKGNGHLYTRKFLETAKATLSSYFKYTVDEYLEDNEKTVPTSFFASWYMRSAWFDNALLAKDQLRHKMAYVLSQIIVESDFESIFDWQASALTAYYDILYNNAFGNYRKLLIDISHNSGMSLFLTFVGNKPLHKNKAGIPVYPDENYARELMQLFSIGINKLNMDGTPILDKNGNEIPTYKQQDVNEIARIFTGWGLRHADFDCAGSFCGDFLHPTKFYPNYHDNKEKKVLGQTIPANLSGDEEIEKLIDILMSQDSAAPFLAKNLIMRFTKSNPSPAYIKRVATIFKNSHWDFKKVIKAIFTDPEFIDDLKNDRIIKFKEPLIAYTSFLRQMHTTYLPYFYFCNDEQNKVTNTFWINDTREYLGGQGPMGAKNVFGFYDNTYIPNDPTFKKEKTVAPELQIQSDSSIITYANKVYMELGRWEKGLCTSIYLEADGKEYTFDTIEDFIEFRYKRFGCGSMFYVGWDSMLLDAKDEYNVMEKVIDGDTNGDFKNLTAAESYTDDTKAIKALIDFADKKFLGGMLTEKEKEAMFKPLKNWRYFSAYDGRRDPKKSKKYQLYTDIIRHIIRAVVTSDAYMTE